MEKPLVRFGKNVRSKRQTMKMSQEELAYQIDVDPRTIVAIETGNRNTTVRVLQRLC